MSVLKSSFEVFLMRIWGAVVGLVVSIIIARFLGPEGKGMYSLLLLVPTLLVTFGNGGLQTSNVYFYGRKLGSAKQLAANSIWAAFVFGLIIFALFAFTYPFLAPRFYADVPTAYLFVVVAMVPLMLLNAYFANLLLALKKVRQFNLSYATQLTALLITIVLFVVVFKAGLVSTVVATVVNVVVGVVLAAFYLHRSERLTLSFHWKLFKATMSYGLKSYFANVIQFLNYRLDLLLVSFFIGTVAVGWYSVAVNFAEVLWYVPTSIGTILFPHVANSSEQSANIMTARISRQTLLLMTLASGVVALISPYIIPLVFGPEFSPAINALLILLPGVLLFSLAKIIGNDFSGRGLVVTNGIVSAIALGLNIALNVILIPRMGINGAALSSTITYSIATILLIGLFSRHAKVSWTRLVFPENGDIKDLSKILRKNNG
jgi:O-antigen/teichoic acid export membrane protein